MPEFLNVRHKVVVNNTGDLKTPLKSIRFRKPYLDYTKSSSVLKGNEASPHHTLEVVWNLKTKVREIAPEDFEAPAGVIETEAFKLTRVHWALIALAALSVLFILFITIARSIQIATVTVDLNNPDEFLVQPAKVEIASLKQEET